jgi:hypothetical protein
MAVGDPSVGELVQRRMAIRDRLEEDIDIGNDGSKHQGKEIEPGDRIRCSQDDCKGMGQGIHTISIASSSQKDRYGSVWKMQQGTPSSVISVSGPGMGIYRRIPAGG